MHSGTGEPGNEAMVQGHLQLDCFVVSRAYELLHGVCKLPVVYMI